MCQGFTAEGFTAGGFHNWGVSQLGGFTAGGGSQLGLRIGTDPDSDPFLKFPAI